MFKNPEGVEPSGILLLLLLCFINFNLSVKMLAYVCHKSRRSGTEFRIVFKQEIVSFKGKITLIINVSQCMTYGIPVDSCASGERVQILNVVHVVYVQASEAVVTDSSDGILRLSAAKCYVTEVETNRKCLGIV